MTAPLSTVAAAWAARVQNPAPGGGVSDITPTRPAFDVSKFTALAGWIQWGALIVCAIGVMVIGTMLAVSIRRGETGDHVAKLGAALVGTIIVGLAPAIVRSLV